MTKIHILSDALINKISAGEVVERPASVLKELMDNAIDAGAKSLSVVLENGGISHIRVIDDGIGMDAEDLEKSLLRHGTSKISAIDDLYKIASLGFRGEALASISSISKTTIKSKQKDSETGHEIRTIGDSVDGPVPVGMSTGTQVMVKDIFFNVPARAKFLKTAATEYRYCLQIFQNFALAYPEIGFKLTHNKKTVLAVDPTSSHQQRIQEVFGHELSESLLPLFYDHPYLQISGYASKPHYARNRADRQYIFVNSRRITSKLIATAARQAYGTLLPFRSYPVYFVYIDIQNHLVDVNVHPRKEEVKFVDENMIFSGVKNSIDSALRKTDLTQTPLETPEQSSEPKQTGTLPISRKPASQDYSFSAQTT